MTTEENTTNLAITLVISFTTGIIFTLGLILSQMVDPNKVIAFLRVVKDWDPSLGLVMGGAITVAMPAFFYAKARVAKNKTALDGSKIQLPIATKVTPQLVVGSSLFGIGWGLIGFCPAPALVSAFAGYSDAIIFVIAMLVGFWVYDSISLRS